MQPTRSFHVTEFLWKSIGMHLVCKYSCYSCFITAVPTCSRNFYILVTVVFRNILESISHAKAPRVGRELLVPYPQSCDWRVRLVGVWLLPGSRTSTVRVWRKANFTDNKWRCVRISKAFLFSVDIAWFNAKHLNAYASASHRSSANTSMVSQSWRH